jgi:hypothetical protein
MAAAGLLTTSRVKGIDPDSSERLRAAAARALARLSSPEYVSPSYGLWIAPVFSRASIGAARGGLDIYATAAGYTGLTMLGLEWVAEDINGLRPPPDVGIGADEAVLGLRLGHTGSFIVLRKGPVWMSVKEAPPRKDTYTKDLRYGEGLNGLEVLRDGVWDRILPPLPYTKSKEDVQPAGPVLRKRNAIGRPFGHSLRVVGQEVVMDVDYKTTGGRALAERRKVQYQPTPCGVQLSFRAFAHEEWIYSAFFGARAHRVGTDAVADQSHVVSARGPHITLSSWPASFHSGEHAHLVRWRVETGANGAYVSFTVCAPGVPAA